MEKKKFIKPSIWILAIICLIFAIISIGTFGTVKMADSYYSAQKWDSDNIDTVVFKLTLNENDGTKILPTAVWGKLSGAPNGESVRFTLSTSTSLTSSFSKSYQCGDKTIVKDYSNLSSYIKLWSPSITSTSRIYFQIQTNGTIKIDELVVLDSSNQKIATEVIYSGPSSSSTGKLSSTIKSEQYASRIVEANKLFDEQADFDYSNVVDNKYELSPLKAFTEKEMHMLESVRNFVNNDGGYVDGAVNPLGIQLIAIGTLIFGANTFGLRIIPFLFAVATLIVAYFIGKLLFDKEGAGILLSVIYLLSGFILSMGTHGYVNSIAIFFITLSFYFMFAFYKRGVNYYAKVKTLTPLALSGIFFVLGFLTAPQIIYSLGALILLFVLTLIRTYKVNQTKIESKSTEQEKSQARYVLRRKINLSIVTFILFYVFAFALLASISTLIAKNLYLTAYSNSNFISIFAKLFTNVTNVTKTSYFDSNQIHIFQHLVNFKAERVSQYKYLTGNVVLSVLSLFSLLYSTAHIILVLSSKDGEKNKKEFKKYVFTPYVLLITAFIFNYLLSLINKDTAISLFSYSSVFFYAFILLAYSIIRKDDKSKLLSKNSLVLKISDVIFISILLFSAVLLGFAYVRLLGIPASNIPFGILSINW